MNLKRSLALALTFVMLLAVAVPMAGAANELPRVAGDNRYLTAVEVSQEGWEHAASVVLARGDDIADALAGVPLAHKLGGPILLTPSTRLHDATAAEIARLNAHKVYILGGEGAISADVVEALEDLGLVVERVAGANRFETAAKIAAIVAPDGAKKVVLVNGLEWADALSAAPYAAAAGLPILTTGPAALNAHAEKALKDLKVEDIIVVGGPAVISDNVFNALTLRSPKRVFGSNRYGTGVALAEEFKLNSTHVYFASGLDASGGVDAIAGAVLAAQQGTGLFLVGNGLDGATAKFIRDYNIMAATVFGGEGAVVPARVSQIANALVAAGGSGVAGWTDPGVEVTVAGKSVKANATTGFYSITGIPTGLHTVSFYMEGKAIATKDVTVVKDGISAVETVSLSTALVKADIEIEGQIVNPTGADVNGVVVTVERWDAKKAKYVETALTATTINGSFSITNGSEVLNFGDKVKLTFTKAPDSTFKGAYKTITRELVLRNDVEYNLLTGLTMTAVEPMTVSGTVIEGIYGVPQPGLIVQFGYMNGTTFEKITATTSNTSGEEGTYEFEDITLPSGTYIIKVDEAGTAVKALHNVTVNVVEGQDLVYNASLVKGYNVNMTIGVEQVGESFTTDADYKAELYKGDALISAATITNNTTTLAATWGRIAPGAYTVKLSGAHLVGNSFPVTVGAADASVISRVNVAGALGGNVTKASTALEGATVELLKKDGSVVATTTTNATGDYIFGGMLEDDVEYLVRVSYPGLKTVASWVYGSETITELKKVVYGATTSFTTIDLSEPNKYAAVTGMVREAGSLRPVATGTVYYHAIDVLNIDADPVVAYKLNAEVATAAIDDGVYTISNLKPGFYRVVVRSAGFENYVTTLRVKADDDLKNVNYTQNAGGNATLNITVSDSETGLAVTDAFGMSVGTAPGTISNLPAGTYYVTKAAGSTFSAVNASVTVSRGGTANLNITMDTLASQKKVTFNLFDETNASTTADKIVIGTTEYTDSTVNLRPGTYVAKIYKTGYLVESVTITVRTTDGDFTLAPMKLTPWN